MKVLLEKLQHYAVQINVMSVFMGGKVDSTYWQSVSKTNTCHRFAEKGYINRNRFERIQITAILSKKFVVSQLRVGKMENFFHILHFKTLTAFE